MAGGSLAWRGGWRKWRLQADAAEVSLTGANRSGLPVGQSCGSAPAPPIRARRADTSPCPRACLDKADAVPAFPARCGLANCLAIGSPARAAKAAAPVRPNCRYLGQTGLSSRPAGRAVFSPPRRAIVLRAPMMPIAGRRSCGHSVTCSGPAKPVSLPQPCTPAWSRRPHRPAAPPPPSCTRPAPAAWWPGTPTQPQEKNPDDPGL